MENHREERRLAYRLIAYWKKLNREPGLPDIRQFNAKSMGESWESCLRVGMQEMNKTRAYKYEYMGPEIVKAYGKDLTGQTVTPSIRAIPGANVIKKLDASIPMHEPVLEQGALINNDDKMIKYRSCILPFGDKNFNLSHAIIGLSWKADYEERNKTNT